MNRMPGGEVEIVDYKTGRPRDEKKADADLQLSVYALAAQEVLELRPGRLVFYNLGTNEAVGYNARQKSSCCRKTKDSGSRGPDSRWGVFAEARICLRLLRFQASLPRARAADQHSTR